MRIEKGAQVETNFRRRLYTYPSARRAFGAFLEGLHLRTSDVVLLPAYVGWSSREGSGVFDPIRSLNLRYAFYRLTDSLDIDVEHFHSILRAKAPRVVVLIHYFGRVDPSYVGVVKLAQDHGARVLEDEAHAMLTDLVSGLSGRLGDACIYSLHKLLPLSNGGALLMNPGREELMYENSEEEHELNIPLEYDLKGIAEKRVQNALLLMELLKPLEGVVDPLWDDWPEYEIPQSFPVIVRTGSRDQLYDQMNQAGFGVVSLYHTLIDEISRREFPASYEVSKHILNLPIHQDVDPDGLGSLVDELKRNLALGASMSGFKPSPRPRWL